MFCTDESKEPTPTEIMTASPRQEESRDFHNERYCVKLLCEHEEVSYSRKKNDSNVLIYIP